MPPVSPKPPPSAPTWSTVEARLILSGLGLWLLCTLVWVVALPLMALGLLTPDQPWTVGVLIGAELALVVGCILFGFGQLHLHRRLTRSGDSDRIEVCASASPQVHGASGAVCDDSFLSQERSR